MADGEPRGRVLIVDDDVSLCLVLEADLRTRGYEVVSRTRGEDGIAAVEAQGPFDTVVTDLNLRAVNGLGGIEVCQKLGELAPNLPVILLTGYGSIETAVRAIRAGAYDFLTKPFEFPALALTLDRAIALHRMKDELGRLRRGVRPQSYDQLLGESPPMRALYALLERVADSNATIAITGESGTGKELVARAIHRRSKRAEGPFVALSCGAVPENLLDSELFGHVKGAFTDARADRAGVFREAEGGTLFLDEIGELPLALQPKLLRALQERLIRPVGGNKELPIDVRIVTATNRDLEEQVEQGRFREDLYYRIAVVGVDVPPLRERGTDVLLLAHAFLKRFAERDQRVPPLLPPPVAERMLAHDWPGNVRELQNCIEQALAVNAGPTLTLSDLPQRLRVTPNLLPTPEAHEPSTLLSMAEVEKRYVFQVMQAVKWNKRRAAQVLGFDRSTLYRKLAQFKIPAADEDNPEAPPG